MVNSVTLSSDCSQHCKPGVTFLQFNHFSFRAWLGLHRSFPLQQLIIMRGTILRVIFILMFYMFISMLILPDPGFLSMRFVLRVIYSNSSQILLYQFFLLFKLFVILLSISLYWFCSEVNILQFFPGQHSFKLWELTEYPPCFLYKLKLFLANNFVFADQKFSIKFLINQNIFI